MKVEKNYQISMLKTSPPLNQYLLNYQIETSQDLLSVTEQIRALMQ